MATCEYDLTRKTFVCFLILFVAAAHSQAVELTLHPSKVDETAQIYRLVVKPDKLIDGDAVPLYEKAIQLMPKRSQHEQIRKWRNLPIEQFPQDAAEQVIQNHLESLRLVVKGTRCKECNWPKWKPGNDPPDMRYRDIASVMQLWARLEICRGQYQNATIAMQTAFGMAKHLGQAPTIIQALVGASIGGMTCNELEQFVQCKDAPNLYKALTNLPEPLIDVEKAIMSEAEYQKDINDQERKVIQTSHDRVRLNIKRLDNHVNALQVVEAMRHYATTHAGQLPQALSDIKDIEVPNDLMSGKAFEYRRTTKGAMLKSAIPRGFKERDAIHYEIVLKK